MNDKKGYSYHKRDNKWRAQIGIDGKNIIIGSFKTMEEARNAYLFEDDKIRKNSIPSDVSDYKDIVGYEGLYKISLSGEIISYRNSKILKRKLSILKSGYLTVTFKINGKLKCEYIHRLLYLTYIGDIPKDMIIDHIDRNKLNNNIENLRLVTVSQNAVNSKRISEAKGYSYDKSKKKWVAQISINGKNKYLGRYDTEELARKAYEMAVLARC